MSNELLEYPRRHYGMDHDRYEWSMLQDRKPVAWPAANRWRCGSISRCNIFRFQAISLQFRRRVH